MPRELVSAVCKVNLKLHYELRYFECMVLCFTAPSAIGVCGVETGHRKVLVNKNKIESGGWLLTTISNRLLRGYR